MARPRPGSFDDQLTQQLIYQMRNDPAALDALKKVRPDLAPLIDHVVAQGATDVMMDVRHADAAADAARQAYSDAALAGQAAFEAAVAKSPEAMVKIASDLRIDSIWSWLADYQLSHPPWVVDLPRDPADINREHTGGPVKCWCDRTHPPHIPWQTSCDKAPTCWCGKIHCGAGVGY